MKLKNRFASVVVLSCILASCEHEAQHDHAKMLEDEQHNNTFDTSLSVVVLSPAHTVISSQATVKPVVSSSSFDFFAEGQIIADPQRNEKIAIRIGGRIEKLYVRYDLQYVLKGDPIMDIYSPELRTAEEEYLYILNSGKDTGLLRIAREKLFLIGLTKQQFMLLHTAQEVTETITVYSPYEGYVQLDEPEKGANSIPRQQGAGGMGSMPPTSQKNTTVQSEGAIREGGYVIKGQTLFVMNDFRKVWVVLYSSDATYPVGTAIKLTSEQWKDSTISASIGFAEPTYSRGQKFTSYRVYLDNPDRGLLMNTLVSAEIQSAERQFLELPASCILSLGTRKIVWVKTGQTAAGSNIFEARNVITRNLPDSRIEIISGISANDEVAVSAGFLIDSQSLINPE